MGEPRGSALGQVLLYSAELRFELWGKCDGDNLCDTSYYGAYCTCPSLQSRDLRCHYRKFAMQFMFLVPNPRPADYARGDGINTAGRNPSKMDVLIVGCGLPVPSGSTAVQIPQRQPRMIEQRGHRLEHADGGIPAPETFQAFGSLTL